MCRGFCMANQSNGYIQKSSVLVSASEVGEVSFCELRYLNRLKGLSVNRSALHSAKRGNDLHERQNRVGQDRRCFVATYLYSADSAEVLRLRVFRDQFLMVLPFGSSIVSLYYFVSPYLVKMCQKSKFLTSISRRFVKCFLFLA